MKISIRYIKVRDLFELQIIETKLRSHFLLNREELNNLRAILERTLIESSNKK
jgi:hypothetical protein